MFQPKPILKFLSTLKDNNNKVWFDEHRETYQQCRKDWIEFVQVMLAELTELNDDFFHQDPRKCIYRINRDVRFGKDKTPYKTNFGAFFVPGGKMSGRAGYYLHLQPRNCFIAAGMHCPENEKVHLIRDRISKDKGKFRKIVEDFEIRGPKLKRPPRGYEADHPDLELLKLKGYIVLKNIPDSAYSNPDFMAETMQWFRNTRQFVDYLNLAIMEPDAI